MSCRSLLLLLLIAAPASAQSPAPDPTRLTLDRIFDSKDFRGERVPPVKWLEGGAYTTLQPSKRTKARATSSACDAAGKTEVLVAAEKLIPPDAKEPLAIHGYEFSKDLDLVLIYTNSVKVWRQNTRGDYWTFRRSTGKLAKLGGDAKPSTLMFAKLSPDGTPRRLRPREQPVSWNRPKAAAATQLTSDGSATVINGTFDWVYEEEFDCRDGWRWSPDGTADRLLAARHERREDVHAHRQHHRRPTRS